ncbi:MAG: hypothetical protein FJY29_03990 [Betaproteobacteria bacterium]|nr:hypothetical protein [Betaproteobacteria bacterium]
MTKLDPPASGLFRKKEQTQKRKKPTSTINPHRRIQPMDELPVDLGKELERRMDTRTNALLMGMDGGVGRGIDSGSDLNSLTPGETPENEYEPMTDTNPLTENAYIHGVFQENSVFKEDEATAIQHQHKRRTVTNRLETDRIEELPARPREEVSFTPLSRKKKRPPTSLESGG